MRTAAHCLVIAAVMTASLQAAELADYNGDFQGTTPAAGWSYLWNAPLDWTGTSSADPTTNPLGASANYVALQWSGTGWTVDGDDVNSNGFPGNFLRLSASGGHPGRGASDGGGNTQNRAPIAAYTVQADQAGPVYLTNTILKSANSGHTGTLNVRVYVNDTLKVSKIQTGYGTATNISFDAALGNLSAGDTVYVALSPDGNDGSDGFQWDFTLSTTANSTNGPILVADLVDDYILASTAGASTAATTANLGTGWSYLWNAPSDWNLANDPTASSNASDGDITSIATFQPLISSGTRWSPDGNNANLDNAPARFLNAAGIIGSVVDGHPGAGRLQSEGIGNDEDRYVIYAYTVDTDGQYAIIDSTFSTVDAQGDGNNVRIFTSLDAVNVLFDTTWDGVTNAIFDTDLGKLSAGDVIYVAVGVGSGGLDANDSYRIDFSIAAVPTPAALPAGLMLMTGLAMKRRRARG